MPEPPPLETVSLRVRRCAVLAALPPGPRRDGVARFIVLLIVVAIVAPLVVKLLGLPGPYVQNPNLTDAFGEPSGPTAAHPFGVDGLGEDIAARSHLRSEGLARGRDHRHRHRDVIGVVVGLLAGFYRGWVDTVLSRFTDLVLSFPDTAVRHRPRLGLRRQRLPRRHDQARGPGDHRDHRDLRLDLHRAHRPRAGAVASREGVRRGLALAGRVEHADHVPRDPAEPGRAGDRLREPVDPDQHPVRGGAVVPRGRRPAADRELGPDDRRRGQTSSRWPGGTWSSRASRCCSRCWRSTCVGDGLQDALNPKGIDETMSAITHHEGA